MERKMMKTAAAAAAAVLGAASANASGFALYQASALSHAMGGALVGKAMDASANFNNPATLTDLDSPQFTIGFVTEHPRASIRGTRNGIPFGDRYSDPGMFWLPHLQIAAPLPAGFTFGVGFSAEYGLGTQYDDLSPLAWNSTETTVQGYVINPNIAYKITEDWSVAAGVRLLYFDFEQYKRPTTPYGTIDYRLHGDNRFESVGWQVGTKYDILDNLSAGLVYKAPIPVDVRGYSYAGSRSAALQPTVRQMYADASADLVLPQSVTGGINWDVVDTWHLGLAVSWTEWSELDMILFNVRPTPNRTDLGWNDTWRGSVGSCWDFIEDWKWLVSYTFDMDCCLDKDQTSTMLPPAHRNILATGLSWNCWAGLELTLSYSCIFTDGGSFDMSDSSGSRWHVETCKGFCHAGGFSVTYRF